MSENVNKALEIDTLINSKYLIKRVISIGNIGITYLVEYQKLLYIVKEFFPVDVYIRDIDKKNIVRRYPTKNRKKEDVFKRNFISEGTILKILDLECVPKYIEEFNENGTNYIVMEYIEGIDLKEWSRQNKTETKKKFEILEKIAMSLEEIHEKGIIHRDIKPSNILIDNKNRVYLIDFGSSICKEKEEEKEIFISEGYSAIEMYSKLSNQDERVDIYSLGGVIYSVFTEKQPVDSSKRIIEDQMKEIVNSNSNLSYVTKKLILKMMEMKMQKRVKRMKIIRRIINIQKNLTF